MTEHLKAVRLGTATTKPVALVVVIAATVIPSRSASITEKMCHLDDAVHLAAS